MGSASLTHPTAQNTMAGPSFTVGVAAPVAASFFYGVASLPISAVGSLEAMTDMQWFAFVILPLCVGVIGGLAAWAGRRFIP
jgi:hypothetical protein